MYKGKTCVITGGARGIGKTIIMEFAKLGCNIAFADKDDEEGRYVQKLIETEYGVDVFFFNADIVSEEDIQIFGAAIIEEFGQVDFLINNACINNGGVINECSFDEFTDVMKVGVIAPYMLALLFKDVFTKKASIVNIASTRAFMSQKNTESYAAAKGALVSLTHALAATFDGAVRVNCVSPGWIDTSEGTVDISDADKKQHTSKRVGEPFDVARAVMFLCDDRADFINAQNITVDGGMTKLMVYHGEDGWDFKSTEEERD